MSNVFRYFFMFLLSVFMIFPRSDVKGRAGERLEKQLEKMEKKRMERKSSGRTKEDIEKQLEKRVKERINKQLEEQTKKKVEERAVWLTTVYRLDWPKSNSAQEQKDEMIKILDDCKEKKINRIYFQVHCRGDAFYYSKDFPSSKWFTGELGKKSEYDSLKFVSEKCKERNIKLEAWINPFVISNDGNFDIDDYFSKLPEDSKLKGHKDWVLKIGNCFMFNPGLVEVREFISDEAKYISQNYDISGIHIDDYFYPYPSGGIDSEKENIKYDESIDADKKEYEKYLENGGKLSIGDWRRNNADEFIKLMHDKVHSTGKTFSVSPFGIWKNLENTRGLSSYYGIYADSKKWVENNWVDYIVPQIYWHIGYEVADFESLSKWWNDICKDTKVKLILGLAAYRVDPNSTIDSWKSPNEIKKQIDMLRNLKNVIGFSLFRYSSVRSLSLDIFDI